MKERSGLELTSNALHLLAMGLMLCDHLWLTMASGNEWMTCVGRLSFPIFAFLLSEGYFYTKNRKRYGLRLLLFAVLSEIPFNLMVGGRPIPPPQQNVLWSFLICLVLIYWNESARLSGKRWLRVLVACGSVLAACLLGILTLVDYVHGGILTVLVFYFFRDRNWKCFLAQLVCLGFINLVMLAGPVFELSLPGMTISFPRQGFALLALIPIWLYRGERGSRSKALQLSYYLFYPLHLFILGIVKMM